jgi:ATP-dependent DNA helicase RecG
LILDLISLRLYEKTALYYVIRNPIFVSLIAKGLLPYRGLGFDIKRTLEDWPAIDLSDDREGSLFAAIIHRKEGEGSEISSEKVIALMRTESGLSAKDIAKRLDLTPRAIEKQIAILKKSGKIRRVGPAKGGHWEVLN